ncbi:hypothetical protein MGG_06960 [Pyricularia oryzae 70-15]|uniref:CENP-C homolog n=3 Tax=Pyricularia oryzae TaxID=318829 RepID=G4MNI0_PYRO7|nr:uncharacterized protein MGG_06960 [Pyricularia oryzae 70-15]EHA57094.1 hypothetical protein MGG_06960 [Pyricularia oryzae 70-15]ELQ35882.1 hypothetical protein OOU_Y34scaffold00684g22 [Pyricularia oryzae Y34]KAI7914679.1 hypothetical protein M0657_009371 [Pyricularia oryzae]KAI7929770.1 hypothetical protein M9X92_001228 [Pyricularia oryzae]
MAPQGRKSLAAPRSTQEKVFELGKQGRKTGVTLPESGVRDENGIESFKGIFDSPGKGSVAADSDEDESSEEEDDEAEASMDMDIAETPGPEPLSLLAKHTQSLRRPTAKAKSPALTSLQSPPVRAGQNSPLRRAPPVAPVNGHKSATMRLNFDARQHGLPKPGAFGGKALQNGGQSEEEEEEYEEEEDQDVAGGEEDREMSQEEVEEFIEESMQMLDAGDDEGDVDESEPEPEPEPEPRPAPVTKQANVPKKRGRPPKSADSTMELPEHPQDEDNSRATADSSPPIAKKRGRPAKGGKAKESPAPSSSSGNSAKKRGRGVRTSNSDSIPEEAEPEPENAPATKRQRVAAAPAAAKGKPGRKPLVARAAPQAESSTAAAKPAGKRGRPAKRSSGDGDRGAADESVVIMPRPPLPKRGGLVISRPEESDGVIRTRSGRNSYRPLQHWRNERVEFEQVSLDARLGTSKSRDLLMPSIKEIVRVEEEEAQTTRRYGSRRGAKKGGRGRRRTADSEDEDEEPSPWEQDPGELIVPVQQWQPEHEFDPPGPDDELPEGEDVVAVSGPAIRTREILGSSFRFTKTLSLPFFGTGVVDLPPGAEKKAKNSRKMHMTFIVHTGRVTVTVNNTAFSIGKGGMWFVPRGNYYSIANEGAKSSRIFFAQACEYRRPDEDEQDEMTESS